MIVLHPSEKKIKQFYCVIIEYDNERSPIHADSSDVVCCVHCMHVIHFDSQCILSL